MRHPEYGYTFSTPEQIEKSNQPTATQTAGPCAIQLGQRVLVLGHFKHFDRGTVVQVLGPEYVAVDLDGYRHNPVDFHACELV